MEKNAIVSFITNEYINSKGDWYLGYSGGKDSTALLVLVLNALKGKINPNCRLHVVYCDTGVEFPFIADLVKNQFCMLKQELYSMDSVISFDIVKPSVEDRYFTMVIGNGYVPPTFLFRWCTRRLRIKPIQQYIRKPDERITVLLGIRNGESQMRDNVIGNHRTSNHYYTKQVGYPNTNVFCPIIDFSVEDVWNTITNTEYPIGIARKQIRESYSYIGTNFTEEGEFLCDRQQGRYGCWTCTVVRKDKAMKGLIDNGHLSLVPLHEFMNWLREIREKEETRDPNRITHQSGKGPFNMNTRKEILQRLFLAQEKSGIQLIGLDELNYIYNKWKDATEEDYFRG